MQPFCVIPARRGSKRLIEKNIVPLGGRPMMVYTIDAALASGVFDRVIVSTEDEEIGALATSAGAVFHKRPEALAGDLVSATDVCLEAYERLCGSPKPHDAIVCLQPSSPLRTAVDVREAWDAFTRAGADFLVSVTPIDPHYFHWAVHQADGDWRMWFGERFLLERPLLPPVYRPNGAIKIGRAGPLARLRNFFGPRLLVLRMDEERSVHVATRFDLVLVEALLRDTATASGAHS